MTDINGRIYKPIINISEFEAEELIMVSNMSIDDLNTDTGWGEIL